MHYYVFENSKLDESVALAKKLTAYRALNSKECQECSETPGRKFPMVFHRQMLKERPKSVVEFSCKDPNVIYIREYETIFGNGIPLANLSIIFIRRFNAPNQEIGAQCHTEPRI